MEGGASQSWGSVQTWHVPALSPALSAGNQIVLMAPVLQTHSHPLPPRQTNHGHAVTALGSVTLRARRLFRRRGVGPPVSQ